MSGHGAIGPAAVGIAGTGVVSLVGLVVLAGALAGANPASASGSMCTTSGPIPGLSDQQAANARTVAAVAGSRGGPKAAELALMVGLTESGLRNLGNPSQATAGLPGQGIGTDHDSLGIFQQRASWGTPAQRMDIITSTELFLDRLTSQPDWQSRPSWVAAQEVQVSAWDGRPRASNHFSVDIGGNYRVNAQPASSIYSRISADASRSRCVGVGGASAGAMPPGSTESHGLPAGYSIPPSSLPGRTAVQAALGELGRPYVWDAAGPTEFDCSGLMLWAWARAGVTLAHYTGDQAREGTATTSDRLLPGDLVLVPGSDGTLADPQHVGMFIGHGLVVEAPETGDVVKVVSYSSFISEGLSGLRHIE